ncbi:MAG: ATP-binding cassette domain-containing protein [Chloroflexi bacterium]|nr:ATP-binding cassette domain-containing protein [Chloroflexota bacterium]
MKIEIRNISKFYGKLKANDDVSLQITSGKILGILGENGAGKSTLMKILSGLVKANDGEILIDGTPVKIDSPRDAIKLGIGMLHQEPRDFPSMSIMDDLRIGFQSDGNKRKEIDIGELSELSRDLGFSLDFDGPVRKLTVGERQELELIRLLYFGVNVLILDEPTTGISLNQKNQLFNALRKLAADGKSILFVSHKLEEIQALCNLAAIMRRGKLVQVMQAPLDQNEMIRWMFGQEVNRQKPWQTDATEIFFETRNLNIDDFRIQLSSVDLQLKRGEVIGLAGMAGSGQKQFLRTAAGLMPPAGGEIMIHGERITGKSCFSFQGNGIHFVPSDRLEEGLLPGMTLSEHYQLVTDCGRFWVNDQSAAGISGEKIDLYRIKGNRLTHVEELSGGNQQRMLLSMIKEPSNVLLLEEPTRGLDIESANWIWSLLRLKCQTGTGIIFSSADLDELLFYSDRIMVFYSGEVTAPIPVDELTETNLGAMIGGKDWVKG